MAEYELMCILSPDTDSTALEQITERLQEIVTQAEGQIETVDRWGKRRLAYEIEGRTEGQYVVMLFASDPGVPSELERVLNLDERVMRHMLFRRDQ